MSSDVASPLRQHPSYIKAEVLHPETMRVPAAPHGPGTNLAEDEDVTMLNSPEIATTDDPASSAFDAMQSLGQKAKSLVDAVKVLEHAGVEASGLPLPKIVAVGDQSAGKSSLIEAISAIRVPRATNTCTRCPLQISLTQDSHPSWKVTLLKKYFYDPPTNRYAGSAQDVSDIGPWKRMNRPENGFSCVTHNEQEVMGLIEKAQMAILCPRVDSDSIMQGSHMPATPDCEFSPNIVKLEITGPSLPTLMMYDLPGIISQSHTGDDTLPFLIQRLAEEYIQNNNTIVVLACPIGSDHVNSRAAKVVKDCNAEARTVGVITKPDKLDMTDYTQWADMLAGNKFKLGHGYFVTKQLGADETFKSHKRTREKEAKFFLNNKNWTDSRLHIFAHRFGTPKLQAKLSELLAKEISDGLPIINRNLGLRIQKLSAQLTQFPKPTENAYSVVFAAIHDIEREVQHLVRGQNGSKELIMDWKNTSELYSKTLKDLKPGLVVSTGPEAQWQNSSSNPIAIDSDDEDEAVISTPSTGGKRTMQAPHTPTKRQRGTPSSTPHHGKWQDTLPERSLYSYPPVANETYEEHQPKWNLEYIRTSIRNESTSGIPRATDPAAEDALIKQAVSKWDLVMSDVFDEVKRCLFRHVTAKVDGLITKWQSTDFYRRTNSAVEKFLDETCDQALKLIMTLYEAKMHKPFTLNIEGLDFATSRELNAIKQSRRGSRAKAYVVWKAHPRRLEAADIEKGMKSVKDAELGEDPYSREINVVSEIRGYYNLAAANMVDTVGELVLLKVFEQTAREIRAYITHALNLDGGSDIAANANQLLAEDHSREQQRAKLEAELKKLQEASNHLNKLKLRI